MRTITLETAKKVLSVVDAGLCAGMGVPVLGKMCVEAAVCFALGMEHGDTPDCVDLSVRALKINLNDAAWSSNQARAAGMRRLAIAQLGTLGTLDSEEFVRKVAETTIRKVLPRALRRAGELCPDFKDRLERTAVRCEKEGSKDAADAACDVAYAASVTYTASVADVAHGVAYATRNAVDAAGAIDVVDAACDAGRAARSAAYIADDVDAELSFFAEEVVQILVEMKSPGSLYLGITN